MIHKIAAERYEADDVVRKWRYDALCDVVSPDIWNISTTITQPAYHQTYYNSEPLVRRPACESWKSLIC